MAVKLLATILCGGVRLWQSAAAANWPLANERMAAALEARGYHYQ
jgi:hypothetical protein